jgi:hypothetical protein
VHPEPAPPAPLAPPTVVRNLPTPVITVFSGLTMPLSKVLELNHIPSLRPSRYFGEKASLGLVWRRVLPYCKQILHVREG